MKCELLYTTVIGSYQIATIAYENGDIEDVLFDDDNNLMAPTSDITEIIQITEKIFIPGDFYGAPCLKQKVMEQDTATAERFTQTGSVQPGYELQIATASAIAEIQLKNENLAAKAKAKVMPIIDRAKKMHEQLATADAIMMEALDAELNAEQVKLKDAYDIMEGRRKPITAQMDLIKSKMIQPGKDLVELGNMVKPLRDNWAREKAKRDAEMQKKKDAEIFKANELARVKKEWQDKWNNAFFQKVKEVQDGLNNKFYTFQSQEAFDAWIGILDKWDISTVKLSRPLEPTSSAVTPNEVAAIGTEIGAQLEPTFNADWHAKMSAEITGIKEKIPARLLELQDAALAAQAEERRKKEDAERAAALAAEQQAREQATEAEAQVTALTESMQIAADAVPTVQQTKNTTVKRIYNATTHQAWVAIIQSWVANDMALMTPDELSKKLSFMKTAAEKRLNDAKESIELTAQGLLIEEDYSARATRGRR